MQYIDAEHRVDPAVITADADRCSNCPVITRYAGCVIADVCGRDYRPDACPDGPDTDLGVCGRYNTEPPRSVLAALYGAVAPRQRVR